MLVKKKRLPCPSSTPFRLPFSSEVFWSASESMQCFERFRGPKISIAKILIGRHCAAKTRKVNLRLLHLLFDNNIQFESVAPQTWETIEENKNAMELLDVRALVIYWVPNNPMLKGIDWRAPGGIKSVAAMLMGHDLCPWFGHLDTWHLFGIGNARCTGLTPTPLQIHFYVHHYIVARSSQYWLSYSDLDFECGQGWDKSPDYVSCCHMALVDSYSCFRQLVAQKFFWCKNSQPRANPQLNRCGVMYVLGKSIFVCVCTWHITQQTHANGMKYNWSTLLVSKEEIREQE